MNLTDKDLKLIAPLLWDADCSKVDLSRDKQAIIERVLVYGRPEHIRWMNGCFTEEDIIGVVTASRNIDKKTASYWALHFHISPEKVRCFSKP